MDFAFMRDTFWTLLSGVPLTLNLAFTAVALGAVLAMLIALMRMSGVAVLDWLARGYVFVFRGSPLLVQIFLIYYGLGQFRPTLQEWGLWGFFREPYWCAIFALTLNTAAYASEIIRGGLQSVPAQQVEAARACGMSGFLLFRRIIFPIAVRQALPAYGSELILMVKATSLASIITMMEVTGLAAKLISQTFRAVEVFVVAGLIYLVLNFIITRIIMALEWWLSPHLRRPPEVTLPVEAAHV
ncbi:ABC transporter permease [Microvirga pudoricolor]|uniref:ABC transporter permease n=1 Tax=Microvirga pudoricolor TaxID=2778729 RepID=UPI00194EF4B5|nr:ABC transporter permease [Microvirga pudoricolor]MBM6592813.1 ABC transporter permease [Microvirga pudoricolor]